MPKKYMNDHQVKDNEVIPSPTWTGELEVLCLGLLAAETVASLHESYVEVRSSKRLKVMIKEESIILLPLAKKRLGMSTFHPSY